MSTNRTVQELREFCFRVKSKFTSNKIKDCNIYLLHTDYFNKENNYNYNSRMVLTLIEDKQKRKNMFT